MPAGERATSWRAPGAIVPRPAPVETLLERLNNVQPSGSGRWTATCPAHGSGTNRALSIAVPDGKMLIHCFGGCAADAVLAAVGLSWRDLYTGESRPWRPLPPPGLRLPPARRVPTPDRVTAWEGEWQRALADHPLLRRYLAARGLAITLPPTLRIGYLYGAPYMLARVEGVTGALVGLHRTWLAPDGSARREKKLAKRSSVNGAAIRLYAATERLALAEGIETALAVHQLTQWPTWATISAGGMRDLDLPDGVRDALICADNDGSGVGQESARTLARRLVTGSRRVRLSIPPEPGSDWLDVLTGATT